MLKVLVLGSNGFIGRNIVEYYENNLNIEVLAPKRAELNLNDTVNVEKYFIQNLPDVVIHSAVNIHSLEENLQMYFNIQRCSKYFGRLITIGSGAEYDMKNYIPLMKEEYFNKHIPSDTYGLSKFVASNDIERLASNSYNLRVFGIFGKYEDYTRRFISNNICKALCGSDISLFQDMKFDFLYIKDFLKILDLFLENTPNFNNYNICTSKPTGLLDLAKTIHKIHNCEETNIVIKEEGIKPEYSGDNTRFIKEFGKFEFTNFETSIQELYNWYKTIDLSNYKKILQEETNGK